MHNQNKKLKILFRVDFSSKIGIGHLMRCLTLANKLKERDISTAFIVRDFIGNKYDLINNHELFFIPEHSTLNEDYYLVEKIIKEKNFNFVIIDNYSIDSKYLTKLKKLNIKLMVIDDLYDRVLPVDIVLNQNLYANEEDYSDKILDSTRLFLGSKYVLIRDDFLTLKKKYKLKSINDSVQNIVITIGGADPNNQTEKILSSFIHIRHPIKISPFMNKNLFQMFNIRIIVGNNYNYIEQLKDKIDFVSNKTGYNIGLFKQVSNIQDFFTWADLAITAGGSTCYELLLMGTPMLLIETVDNQIKLCKYLHNNKLAINLGWYENVNQQKISFEIEKLMLNKSKRVELSSNGISIIDGNGSNNVVDSILSYYNFNP